MTLRARALAIAAVLLLTSASVAHGEDSSVDASVDAATADVAVDPVLEELARIERGELPRVGTLHAVLGVDPRNEKAVADAVAMLGTSDAKLPPKDEARLRVLRASLAKVIAKEDAQNAEEDKKKSSAAAKLAVEKEALEADLARKKALVDVDEARNAVERLVAAERARAEGIRLDQANLRKQLHIERERFADHLASASRDDGALALQAQQVSDASESAAILYDALVERLIDARDRLDAALSAVETVDTAPQFSLAKAVADAAPAKERAELVALETAIASNAEDLTRDLGKLEWDRLRGAHSREQALNDARIALIPRLPRAKRDAVLGFGPQGIAQFRRELRHIGLQLRWYRLERAQQLRVNTTSMLAPATVVRPVGRAFWVLLLISVAGYLSRRGADLLEGARRAAVRGMRGSWLAGPAVTLIGAVHALAPELVLFATILLLPRALADAAAIPEVFVAIRIALYYAVYRLALSASFRVIAWLSRGERARLPAETSEKVLASLRVVGRYALAISVTLVLSAAVLGRGYLYALVARSSWIGALPIAITLVRWWRDDIADAYLRLRPRGVLADRVRATRDRWFGFFVASAAVFTLAIIAITRIISRTVLGFEQSRKALAYLFRKRLERQADHNEDETVELPDDLVAALDEGPVDDPPLAIPHYPGLDLFSVAIEEFRAGKSFGSLLLVADSGYGKSSWLCAARRTTGDIRFDTLALEGRIEDPYEFLTMLNSRLGTRAASLNALTEELASGPPRVIAIDDGQLLFRRGLSGLDVWDAFTDVVARTGRRVFWMCAIARYPEEYLRWAKRGMTVFRSVVRLRPWTEDEIAALLRRRVEAAGYEVRYDDLVVERLEGTEASDQLLRTENEYARLIWDYAEGCPRTALRCWRASLVPNAERTLRVRLFRRVAAAQLESLSSRQAFVLAALVWHQAVSVEQVASTLRLDKSICTDTLAQLEDWGVLERSGDQLSLVTAWLQPVRRYLRRLHLIEA